MSKEHVRELEIARGLIKRGDVGYICHALSSSSVGIAIRKQIKADMEADDFFGTAFETWLNEKHGIKFQPFSIDYHKKVTATRLAWIDALIEYWRDKP